jgi:hypothetical protein
MKLPSIGALALGVTLLAAVPAGAKDDFRHQCLQDARVGRNDCVRVCQDDFLASVDTCRGSDHDCAQAARDARDACVSDVLHVLKQCLDDTCGAFAPAVEQCRADFAKGTPERDACIDAAQIQNFKCRDDCRESVQLFAELKTCRSEFKADLGQCSKAK